MHIFHNLVWFLFSLSVTVTSVCVLLDIRCSSEVSIFLAYSKQGLPDGARQLALQRPRPQPRSIAAIIVPAAKHVNVLMHQGGCFIDSGTWFATSRQRDERVIQGHSEVTKLILPFA